MAKDTPEPWARRHAFVALDDRELAAMLRPLFGERRVESAEPLTGGFVNTNYRVRLAGLDDAFVLRSYVRDAGACQRERDIIARVQGRVPVAEVLYADTRGEAFGRPYAVMRWMEGVALDQLLARPAEADPVALASHARWRPSAPLRSRRSASSGRSWRLPSHLAASASSASTTSNPASFTTGPASASAPT